MLTSNQHTYFLSPYYPLPFFLVSLSLILSPTLSSSRSVLYGRVTLGLSGAWPRSVLPGNPKKWTVGFRRQYGVEHTRRFLRRSFTDAAISERTYRTHGFPPIPSSIFYSGITERTCMRWIKSIHRVACRLSSFTFKKQTQIATLQLKFYSRFLSYALVAVAAGCSCVKSNGNLGTRLGLHYTNHSG